MAQLTQILRMSSYEIYNYTTSIRNYCSAATDFHKQCVAFRNAEETVLYRCNRCNFAGVVYDAVRIFLVYVPFLYTLN